MASKNVLFLLLYVTNFALPLLAVTYSDSPEDTKSPCATDVAAAVNDLGSGVSPGLLATPGNVFFSPIGLSFALGMAYSGASGRTAEQFEVSMGYYDLWMTGNQIHQALHDLRRSTLSTNHSQAHDTILANGLFVQQGFRTHRDFTKTLHSYYRAEARQLDFNQSQPATDLINQWSKNKTEGTVDPFLTEPLPSDTKMVSVTAVYFKGTWKIQFPTDRTARDYFYTGRRETTEVLMMSMVMETFNYYEDLDLKYKFIELPYKDDRLSMVLSLPLQYDQPATLLLDSKSFCNVTRHLTPTQLEMVAIPRFSFEFEHRFGKDLEAYGLRDAFDPALADFTKIRGSRDIHLSEVIQKTVVDVEETGSESASVTGSLFMPVAFREITEFVANHPFVFYVVDKESGAFLFVGRVDEPSGDPLTENLKF